MKTVTIIELAVSAAALAAGIAGYFSTRARAKSQNADAGLKKKNKLFLVLMIAAVWFLTGTVITCITGLTSKMDASFEMFSPRITLFGISFARTTVLTWGIIGIVLVLALIFRFAVFPKFDPETPKGFQNVIELSVEAMEKFAGGVLGSYTKQLAPYMYSLAVFMIFSAFSELFGFRPPTSDLLITLAMGLITFVLINFCGVLKKGIGGRVKSLAKPTPIIFPFKIISDIATPISLACRLFGNMVGGMIVMDLLKSVLGGYAVGIPAVAGLYFNLFHPLIQTYIFIILSLTFINEAVE